MADTQTDADALDLPTATRRARALVRLLAGSLEEAGLDPEELRQVRRAAEGLARGEEGEDGKP